MVSIYNGLCRQVVLIQRCSGITVLFCGPTYSGLCRQVVLIRTELQWYQSTMVSVGRWSLYRGAVVLLCCFVDQPTVVSVGRCSCQRCSGITVLFCGPTHHGLCRQVVLIQRCSGITRAAFKGGGGGIFPPLEICCPPCRSAASLNLYLSIYTKGW